MKYLILIVFLSIHVVFSFDFRKYTLINEETKNFLREKNQKARSDSSVVPGIISLFGNSITVEDFFWTEILGSSLGIVPGTLDSSYSYTSKCAQYGMTLWEGSYCVEAAVESVKPEAVIIMYGTNEAMGAKTNVGWEQWQEQYSTYMDKLLSIGIIPIISTIPPLFEEEDSTVVPLDTITQGVNEAIRSLAKNKHVVLVDYHQAMVDYTKGDIFNRKWWDDYFVHPSAGCDPDTSEPTCGYGIRNAVCWQAVNKVYRIIIDDGPPDTDVITYLSTNYGQNSLPVSDNGFQATPVPGSSNIKLSFNPQFQPQSIRLLNLNGKTIQSRVTLNSTDALISMKSITNGVYIVEATTKGKIHYRRVLLTP